jgi:hypothetical protein
MVMGETRKDQRSAGAKDVGSESNTLAARSRRAGVHAIDRVDYRNFFHNTFQNASYYSTGREWSDYEPAYDYGYASFGQYRGQRFEDVEDILERRWDAYRAHSRLAWAEARGAVRDGWLQIERSLPVEAGHDRH